MDYRRQVVLAGLIFTVMMSPFSARAGDGGSTQVSYQPAPNHTPSSYQVQIAGSFVTGLDSRVKLDSACRGQPLLGGLVQLRGQGSNSATCSVVNLN